MIDPARFYSANEVWRTTRAPRRMVYDDLAAGRLRAYRRGRRWLIPGASVLAWIAEDEAIDVRHEDT